MTIKPTGNKHFDKLYQLWTEVTGNTTGKMQALKSFENLSRRDDKERLVNEIIQSIEKKARIRKEMELKQEFVPSWVGLAVYLNQKRHLDDDIEEKSLKTAVRKKYCTKHPDRESVYNVGLLLCCECVSKQIMATDPTVELMRDYCRENGLVRDTDETTSDFQLRLKLDRKRSMRKMQNKLA